MSGESGQWNVDINEDASGVIVEFNHMGDDGVEVFTTAMPPEIAVVFAAAVLNMAIECGPDVLEESE